jgi:long-subunit acyl-CoA synthetase (AMP-forming)
MYFQLLYNRFLNLPPATRTSWKARAALLALVPGAGLRRALASRLLGEFYQQFGSRMRLLITGMAPIKTEVAQFFDMMQLPLCESYGLVETGSLTFRPPHSRKYGSVGKPVRGIAIHLGEDGEVIVERDQFLTRRYFQCADGESERTFIGGNRVATGDIGRLDDDGYLYLLGRKKELIITPGGYKIHPEIVEQELAGCPDIAQAAVFLKPGSATMACVVCLIDPTSQDVRERVRAFARDVKSAKPMQIGEIIFTDAAFSTENGMLRPNLKLDRRAIAARYDLI